MAMGRTLAFAVLMAAGLAGSALPALAQSCTRAGVDVTCDDGRRGIFAGESLIWACSAAIPSCGPTARARA